MILKLPDAIELDLAVGAGARPEFGLSVNGLRLETWDSELVLAMGQEYHFIRLIEENERVISLKLLWAADHFVADQGGGSSG
jgi:hypothetical protein